MNMNMNCELTLMKQLLNQIITTQVESYMRKKQNIPGMIKVHGAGYPPLAPAMHISLCAYHAPQQSWKGCERGWNQRWTTLDVQDVACRPSPFKKALKRREGCIPRGRVGGGTVDTSQDRNNLAQKENAQADTEGCRCQPKHVRFWWLMIV